MAEDVAWRPSQDYIDNSTLKPFLEAHGLADYAALCRRGDEDPAWYWNTVIEYLGVQFYKPYDKVMDSSKGIPWTEWCVGGTTNLVLNCLDAQKDRSREAVVWEGEDGSVRTWTIDELAAETARLANALRGLGLSKGDAVGLFLPMLPETVAAFLAVAKIGGIVVPLFSGFGSDAIVSRLEDAGAVAVITTDASPRRGRPSPMKQILDDALERIDSVRHVIVYRRMGAEVPWTDGRDLWWDDVVAGQPAEAETEEMPADDPFMVIFTSGTTGKAKGTIHTHCGLLIKLAADFGLVQDFQPGDRMLWISDLGWLVGPMQIIVTLFLGGTLVIAEGTPDYPDSGRLWRLVQDHKVTYLGLAATIARAMMRFGVEEVEKHDLSSLRVTVSSGELWNPDSWVWFFKHVCKERVPILNVSGGTEIGWGIVNCTVLDTLTPCSFSGPVPAMGSDVVDQNGNRVAPGEMGELVLRNPSIGLSRGLWNDPDRYLETYWEQIPGLWVQGDWASIDEDGYWYLHGRSDDTIMVAGKRCGPTEVESLLMETGMVEESAAMATTDDLKGEAVICACVPKSGVEADANLATELREAVVRGLGPAFRPRDLIFVSELPKTRSMKVMRRVVRALYEGRDPGDLASLVNPSAVEELRRVVGREN